MKKYYIDLFLEIDGFFIEKVISIPVREKCDMLKCLKKAWKYFCKLPAVVMIEAYVVDDDYFEWSQYWNYENWSHKLPEEIPFI